MKSLKIVLVLLFVLTNICFAEQVVLNDNFNSMGSWKATNGDWEIVSGRLAQLSVTDGMAKINCPVEQSGVMVYEFDVEYIDHGDDQYGAFGIHINIENPAAGRSWGNGESFLLWVTYDPEVYGGTGFRAQCYESENSSEMDEITTSNMYSKGGYEIPETTTVNNVQYVYLDPAYLEYPIKIKLTIDSNKGTVVLTDPLIPNWEYYFNIGQSIPDGSYISLRTSSLSVSFDNFKVTKIR
jgi:hypothetical protein